MSARAQVKKDEIISGLVETRKQILDAASSLPPAKQNEVFLGIWSVKDLLAHLAGWDYTNLEAAREILAGQVPSFYAHYDRDWRTFNAGLVAKYKRDDFGELLSLVEESHRELIEYLKSIPAEEFEQDRGIRFEGHKVTIGRLLQVEIKDEQKHCEQIEEFGRRSQALPSEKS